MERCVFSLEHEPFTTTDTVQLYLFKVPDFMAIEPQAWDHLTFQPPKTDHHSRLAASATFSPYNTALTTIRWRHSPSKPSQLQSNARINRWSDGSLTLQLASDPTVQYEIDGNFLAPPQRNPVKPTPTSIQTRNQKGGRQGVDTTEKYDQRHDAFTYLLRPNEESSTLIVTNKFTTNLTVRQSSNVEGEAIERLQASLAAAANASKVNGASGSNLLVNIDEDPEQAKIQALAAVKEQEKASKRRLAASEREAVKLTSRLQGRGGGRHMGLNVGMLEDDELGGEGQRGRPSPNKARAKPRRRRNSEYSEDEDFGRKRFSREDEYDEEDDFVAPSDEEEVVEDDDDSNDGIVEEDYEKTKKGGKQKSPKRDREEEEEQAGDDEADAPGEDDEAEVQQVRTKRRRVVDDEDEDDE